jgi:hypothetical protein
MLMQEENFILTSDELIDSVSNLIQKYRFDYYKDKELNDKMNFIIGLLNYYKNLSTSDRIYLKEDWLTNECMHRNLPLCYHNYDSVIGLMQHDYEYFEKMLDVTTILDIDNVIEYLSLINIIIDKCPDLFQNEILLMVTESNCERFKKDSNCSKDCLRMIKDTLKKLKCFYKEDNTTSDIINYKII